MAKLPDWSDMPEELRLYAQSQEPKRQRLWMKLWTESGYTREQIAGRLEIHRSNDAWGEAIAATSTLTDEQLAMSEAEFYSDLARRQEIREAERQSSRPRRSGGAP